MGKLLLDQVWERGTSNIDHLCRRSISRMSVFERFPCWMCNTIWNVGRDDPRRVIHAFKVGIALTLVSLLYLVEPLYRGIGQNAIVAVMTVVVVFEFTAGATLCKGMNRGIGTLLAGSLALFIEFLAQKCGRVFQAVFIGFSVFLIGFGATYLRFIPYIKRNFDYGMLIFLLTFNLITVSSYRVDNVLDLAHDRLFMIVIGCAICLFMSLLVFPIWSGQYLHEATASRLEGLARLIPDCVSEYFDEFNSDNLKEESAADDPIMKDVLHSKSTDETLALYARWEPRYSIKHFYKVPYQEYVKLGATIRHFGYTVAALDGCLRTEIQTPKAVRVMLRNPCIRLAEEVSKVLVELSNSIRNRRHCSPEVLSDQLHDALTDLDRALKSQPKLFFGPQTYNHPASMQALASAVAATGKDSSDNLLLLQRMDSSILSGDKKHNNNNKLDRKPTMLRPTLSKLAITSLDFAEALPLAAFASLLVEIVARLDLVIEKVEELATISHFEEFDPRDDQVIIDWGDTKVKVVNTGEGPKPHSYDNTCSDM